ncbi:calcium-translocating P-type ATPase [Piedraia hortae CBS 480.64]|uniref:Calcium-transporting ATPase n=1 Tax=Piedraia hortae CBS 480.64 TaxID=1314780 RepID=A0A6A7C6G9_9PEZI|nr:calcium-translocating P-type ATPase [Piedraia hortae CBS 480.64]
MAEQQPYAPAGQSVTQSSVPARRPRAPTITIDTSAMGRTSEDALNASEGRTRLSNDDTGQQHLLSPNSLSTPTDHRPGPGSRPTSPHNVSSPSQWNNPNNLLSVPLLDRRSSGATGASGASGDSAGSVDTTSDLTYVNSNTPSSEQRPASQGSSAAQGAGGQPILSDTDALRPDPGTESEFRNNGPFAFATGHLSKLLNPKSLGAFHAMGGLAGIEKGLRTDRNTGLRVDEGRLEGRVTLEEAKAASSAARPTAVEPPEATTLPTAATGSFEDRKQVFGNNVMPQKKQKGILKLMWLAYNDKVLIILTIAAAIALGLGLYQRFETEEKTAWIEGVAIIVAIVVVVMVGAINDWQKERQFAALNQKKEDRNVKVVRSGTTQEISIHDILVGDVLMVEPGDILPVDGIYIVGHGVMCDESSATGESDVVKKTGGDEVFNAMENHEPLKKLDPFMISGGKVTEGFGRMLVTATGVNSSMGKTMMSLQDGDEATPLQVKLNGLAESIAKIGSAAALLLFCVLLIKFLATLKHNHKSPQGKAQEFMKILITAITIIVVAVPEGLPLAVTLSLAYATKRMLKDNNLVRVLRSCETMGNATSVCSDKTGTLTQNVMTLVAGCVGIGGRFSVHEQHGSGSVPVDAFMGNIHPDVKALWEESIALNSTAFQEEDGGKVKFVGSKTETALLDFARGHLGLQNVAEERKAAQIVQLIPFDSRRKCMGVVVKHKDGNSYRLLVKGASEMMLSHCTMIVRDGSQELNPSQMTGDDRKSLQVLINNYADESLRTIGCIYRDFESWPPRGARPLEDDKTQAMFEDVCKNMTFLCIAAIQDPLRPGVPEAVRDCITAGVTVRMVTGDNIHTAKAIAGNCGIYTEGGMVMEGVEFRQLSHAKQREVIPNLQVLARSSPDDKRVLVKRLKEMGETVAATGDGTNDAPALKAADVGFAMNIAGTEVAKEASDIILMDDNFASIVNALMWGRAVNDSVKKFLQFQITVNITAVLLAFISAVSNSEQESVLTAVQLLWVNLIMDTMAALALATDPPTRTVLQRKPEGKSAPLITRTMWKMIIGQAIYQLIITLVLYFAGFKIFGYHGEKGHRHLQTMVFNTFVWMQIFNALNNRRLDNHFNVFEGVFKNWLFVIIMCVMIGGQLLIMFVGGWAVFQAETQTGWEWAVAIVLGFLTLPIGVLIRLIPDAFCAALVPQYIKDYTKRRRDKRIKVEDVETGHEFNQALYDIQNELAFIKKYRGGRLNALKFAVSHPREVLKASHSRSSFSPPRTPRNGGSEAGDDHSIGPPTPESRRRSTRPRSNSALAGAAMAGIIAGSIAGGWSPVEPREGETLRARSSSRSRSRSDVSREMQTLNKEGEATKTSS